MSMKSIYLAVNKYNDFQTMIDIDLDSCIKNVKDKYYKYAFNKTRNEILEKRKEIRNMLHYMPVQFLVNRMVIDKFVDFVDLNIKTFNGLYELKDLVDTENEYYQSKLNWYVVAVKDVNDYFVKIIQEEVLG